jgi:potassium/chloride transporter 4/5/6
MRKDLKTFLYHLRIEADVFVEELDDAAISEYTYERTLLMEQRNEMLKEMRVSEKRRGKKVETVIDKSRADPPTDAAEVNKEENSNFGGKSPSKETANTPGSSFGSSLTVPQNKSKESSNVRRMHTAVRLNERIVEKSHEAKLVILNLPSPPKTMGPDRDASYMEYLEVLTEGLERVLMVRGGGREVITIYS